MTRKKHSATKENWKEQVRELLRQDTDLLKALVQEVVQQVLEAEMEDALGAGKSERTPNRLGYRAGYYSRSLVTRVGKLELRVPQDRQGRFRTEVFERYQRSEKALVTALMEMYLQGVSTRKVKAVTGQLCGHEGTPATRNRKLQPLNGGPERLARQPTAFLGPNSSLPAHQQAAQAEEREHRRPDKEHVCRLRRDRGTRLEAHQVKSESVRAIQRELQGCRFGRRQ
jgi:hypothetical protein